MYSMRAQSLGRSHLLSLIPDCSLVQYLKQDILLIIVIWISSILWIMLWTLYRNFHKLLFRYWWLELATKASTTMKQQIYFLNLMLQVLQRYLSCWGPSFLMSSFPSLKSWSDKEWGKFSYFASWTWSLVGLQYRTGTVAEVRLFEISISEKGPIQKRPPVLSFYDYIF